MFIPEAKLKNLYASGLSMQEIADREKWSYRSVGYWMQKHQIPRRSWSEATYVKRNREGDPFVIKMPQGSDELKLFYISIGLYLGEGDKKSKHRIMLANTDPFILNTFLKFLRELCGVNELKIGASLNIFDDVDLQKAIDFWLDNVGIARKQFKTIIVRKSRGGTYKNKSTYGTLSIYVSNVKLKKILIGWCDSAVNI